MIITPTRPPLLWPHNILLNFYGSVPASANFRNRGNSNQPPPFSANLSVYASLYEKIYLGAYYSRLKHKDGNNNTQRFSSVCFSGMCFACVGIFMFHHVQKLSMTFWAFWSISVTKGLYLPSKELHPWRSWFRSGSHSFSPRACPPGCHVYIRLVRVRVDRYPWNKSRNEYLSCSFHQRQKPDVGERWWAFIWCGRGSSELFLFKVIYLRAVDRAMIAVPSALHGDLSVLTHLRGVWSSLQMFFHLTRKHHLLRVWILELTCLSNSSLEPLTFYR